VTFLFFFGLICVAVDVGNGVLVVVGVCVAETVGNGVAVGPTSYTSESKKYGPTSLIELLIES
jgi:hypothetical protein